jgi:hypothetical protein
MGSDARRDDGLLRNPADRSKREQFWLSCLLENGTDDELLKRGLVKPAIAVLDGRRKPWRTVLSAADYRAVRKVGEEHKRQFPRRIAT